MLRRPDPREPAVPILVGVALLALALLAPGGAAQSVTDLPGSDRALTPALADEFVIGSLDGADWELFGGSVEVEFDSRGNLFVFDADNFRVVKVSPEGELLREFGGQGGGPGELQMPLGFAVTAEDEVVITDLAARALVVFDAQGNYLRNVRLDLAAGLPSPSSMADPAGGLISPPGGIRIRMGGGPDVPEEPGLPIHRFSLEGDDSAPVEVFRAWEPPQPPEGPGAEIQMEGGMSVSAGGPREQAFRPRVHLGVAPDGTLILADSTAWALKVVSSDGSLRQVLRRPIEPRPVTERMQRDEKQRRLDALEEGGSGGRRVRMITTDGSGRSASVDPEAIRKMQEDQIENMVFAEVVPVLAGLAVDRAGTAWVARAGDEPGEPGPMDFVSATGEYLGTAPAGAIRIPNAFGPNGLAAFVESDDMDILRVEVKRVSNLR